ncbi:MAG: hypothetical protein ACETVR_02755 [Candidatus Bathyarchaeia archaeon]
MLEGWDRARELRQELKEEWAELWRTKYDDEVRAEEVSPKEYERLFVDLGEIIHATRDYKPLSFGEILDQYLGSDLAGKISPDPALGGWRKFVKENFRKPKPVKRERPRIKTDLTQQQRKRGRGWLNKARIWKKISLSGFSD